MKNIHGETVWNIAVRVEGNDLLEVRVINDVTEVKRTDSFLLAWPVNPDNNSKTGIAEMICGKRGWNNKVAMAA
ncbi:MAG: hypothetical protein HPY53_01090 [Brevinematales bacterium]|nr:hypothetical protein [Brevinematales bacterium]